MDETQGSTPVAAESFEALMPADYRLRLEDPEWVPCATATADDFAEGAPDFSHWPDNQAGPAAVMEGYFATVKSRLRVFTQNDACCPIPVVTLSSALPEAASPNRLNKLHDHTTMSGEWLAYCSSCPTP